MKLKLAAAGLYVFKERELGACRALDLLLDSHWGQGWRKDPEWPSILSQSEYEPIWDRVHTEAAAGSPGINARSRKVQTMRGYD